MTLLTRSSWTAVLPFIFAAGFALAASEKGSEPNLEERRVEGADAKLLVDALVGSGAKQEPAPDNLPGDHPRMKVAKDFVYRVEAVTCRAGKEAKCDPFVLSAAKAKSIITLLKKIGVKETKPPKSAGKNARPYYYLKEVICGAATAPEVETSCSVMAHFHPKR
jgi:hypothetical protein